MEKQKDFTVGLLVVLTLVCAVSYVVANMVSSGVLMTHMEDHQKFSEDLIYRVKNVEDGLQSMRLKPDPSVLAQAKLTATTANDEPDTLVFSTGVWEIGLPCGDTFEAEATMKDPLTVKKLLTTIKK